MVDGTRKPRRLHNINTLLEQAHANQEGFTFDIGGSHIIFSKDREVLNLWEIFLGEQNTKQKKYEILLQK
jgi:hypothetical protein